MVKTLISGPILDFQLFFRELDIVPSYPTIQLIYLYLYKLMNQTSENDEKPNFGPTFGPFGQTPPPPPPPPHLFCEFYVC